MDNAFGRQKLIESVVLELSTIVTLQNSNLYIELRFYDIIKVSKDRGDLRFETRKTQVRRVWSSIKVMNHHFLDEVVILDGPQISL